jgi:VanZ family protein
MLSTVAFCLPGSALPKETWFLIVELDKWIHAGLFLIMVFLWSMPLLHKPEFKFSQIKLLIVSIVFLCYGVLMEFVQGFFIYNRSFDYRDIAADAVGCLIGFILVKTQWRTS